MTQSQCCKANQNQIINIGQLHSSTNSTNVLLRQIGLKNLPPDCV